GWEAVRPFGPLEKFSQQWNFKPMPGGTEVTLTVKGTVRYRWIRTQMERILHNLTISTLMDLQRQIDAPTAQLVEDMGREMAEKQKPRRKLPRPLRRLPAKRSRLTECRPSACSHFWGRLFCCRLLPLPENST
ncbi:hypothetical protein ACFFU7_18475, partial [Deinococcus wulumuqiensis]